MYKVLIVDDEYEIRHGISSYFPWDELGFEVIGDAENGDEALKFLERQPVDIILCDIRMPVKSGLELAKELQTKEDKPKIVFLTGHKDFEYVKEALICGAKDYIVKPTKYQQLADVFTKMKTELDSEHKLSNPERTANENPERDVQIQAIKEYIRNQFQSAQLKDAAKVVHMNPYYLSSYFKNKTGQSFTDYLLSVKMEKAVEYMSDPQYKTYEISELVGYSNPKNFSKAFKSFYGVNPRQYRNGDRGRD